MKDKKIYTYWFTFPALFIFSIFFLIPMITSIFFSMTVWNLKDFKFVGFQNFIQFFTERSLRIGIKNTLVYAFLTSGIKTVLAYGIAILLSGKLKTKNFLRAVVFFPNLISTIAVGITFAAMMHPTKGLFNTVLQALHLPSINWLGNADTAIFSIVLADIWKGTGVGVIIFLAGILAVDRAYYEAADIDGAGVFQKIRYVTTPLVRPSLNTVIILSLIGGMRSFDLIWSMTKGGPGCATDVVASIVYKQYAAGYYGLSTAGNVILFLLIVIFVFPLRAYLLKKEEY
ncbi:carbohydrate ABC transporter permease [uncultured Robinsoniella sp.]|uniref:carbohydrate ABC transporter permease n=1 Tax=uncultured Robinsoniella sp. TaxID=904190 RepID=UPI00374EACAC